VLDKTKEKEYREIKNQKIIVALKGIEALKRSLEGHKMNLEGIKRTLLDSLKS
jgi:hypothetical protein